MNPLDKTRLQEDFFFLISYLLTSARGLSKEPKEYGVFRLLDTTSRVLEIMETHNLMDDPFYHKLQNAIQDEVASSMEDSDTVERLDIIIAMVTNQIQKKLEN